jgi:hypothetical protein
MANSTRDEVTGRFAENCPVQEFVEAFDAAEGSNVRRDR